MLSALYLDDMPFPELFFEDMEVVQVRFLIFFLNFLLSAFFIDYIAAKHRRFAVLLTEEAVTQNSRSPPISCGPIQRNFFSIKN